jgi:tetratricopeptide (TPR) repeat protein
MKKEFLKSLIINKPGRLLQPVRFFILGYIVITFAACSSGKKITTATPQKDNGMHITTALADTIKSQETLENIFMDAVKAKITDNKEEAFRNYNLYASLQPANATAHYELARIWLDRNNFSKALSESKEALKYDSSNKWMQKQYADLLAYDGQYTDAATVYGKMAAKERAPEEFLIRQAMLLQKAKKYKEALGVMDQLETYLGDDDETLILQRQQLYLSMNDVEAAAGEARKLMKYYPQEPRYALLLAEVYDNNDQPKKAEEAYKEAEHLFPDEPSVQFSLVQYHLKSKNLSQVEYYLEKAVMNNKATMEDRIGLLVPFIQYRSADSVSKRIALDLTKKLALQEPPKVEAITLYADLMVADGQLDEALSQYKRIIRTDGSLFSPWQQIMYIYTTRDEYDSVIAYSNKAVDIFPKEPMAWYLGGLGYMQSKQNGKAIEFLNKAVRYQTNSNDNLLSDMLVSLGDVYNTEARFTSSDSCYRAALNLQPNNATALNNFSYYLSVRGENLGEAEKMSEKSLKLRPNESTFLDTYAWILYKQGKFKEAKVYILKAIEFSENTNDPTVWEHLGDIEYKLGDKKQALEHWKKAQSKGEVSIILQQKINDQKLND